MPRERDRNRRLFNRGHYEVIAARFREEMSRYVDDVNEGVTLKDALESGTMVQVETLSDLACALADRFEFDNSEFDRNTFLERCGVIES